MLKRKKLLEADDALDFGIDVEDTAEDLDNDIEDADNDIEDDMEDTESKESSIVIEKIISPEELSAVKIGGHDDESILDLDTYEVTNTKLSTAKFIITIDADGDEDDGVIVSPLADSPDQDILEVVNKAFEDFEEITDDEEDSSDEENDEDEEDAEDLEAEDEGENATEDFLESLGLVESDESDDEDAAWDADSPTDDAEEDGEFGNEYEQNAEDIELPNQTGFEKLEGEVDGEIVEVSLVINDDGSVQILGDPREILIALTDEATADEILDDLGSNKLESEPTMKIESLAAKFRNLRL